jgi:hypothetical protein
VVDQLVVQAPPVFVILDLEVEYGNIRVNRGVIGGDRGVIRDGRH